MRIKKVGFRPLSFVPLKIATKDYQKLGYFVKPIYEDRFKLRQVYEE
jgi:hypothetical protein